MPESSRPISSRRRIDVRGIVQGVGFRPFVYRLATKLRISGFVRNTSEGAVIEVEGTDDALEHFLAGIIARPPPLAQIKDVSVSRLLPSGEAGFNIQDSIGEAGRFALVSPDVGICEECRIELADPNNRRYGYPFTNCTNCGPRYTIVLDTPYDRPATTMARFQMCATCRAEYDNPADRRFHAQPNACPNCGPGLALIESDASLSDDGMVYVSGDLGRNIILEARRSLHEGAIVAIKGLGGFHLACDAENDTAAGRLRERKRRSDKPFALMAPDLAAVESFCVVSEWDRAALQSPQRPIVILPRKNGSNISSAVAPHNNTLGVMLPYAPIQDLLFRDDSGVTPAFTALVMTSGNLSEEPIVSRNEDVERLRSLADRILLNDRDIYIRADDSVVRTFEGKERTLRRSRGYVPHPIDLGMDFAEILACGADLKNTFCLTRGHYAFLSQHIGDLENYETLVFFHEALEHMKELFRVSPQVVAYDLHPMYRSTKTALELSDLKRIGVQHHHAHVASCMVENRLRGKVLGVVFDGTGYGTDGQIWGGEFFVADLGSFERRAHFRYIPLPGGDTAIRQPWRAAFGWLIETFGSDHVPSDLPLWKKIPLRKVELIKTMIARGLNTIQTSSCGRLFDAVASLLDLRQEINFEGQAAIELEMIAVEDVEESYPFEIGIGDPWQIDFRPTIESIVVDVRKNTETGVISARFHNTVAAVIVEVSRRLRGIEGLNGVCLSGGTFQNFYLLNRAVAGLNKYGFDVYLHSKVPPNDGGISLGQAVIANEVLRRGD